MSRFILSTLPGKLAFSIFPLLFSRLSGIQTWHLSQFPFSDRREIIAEIFPPLPVLPRISDYLQTAQKGEHN